MQCRAVDRSVPSIHLITAPLRNISNNVDSGVCRVPSKQLGNGLIAFLIVQTGSVRGYLACRP